MIKRTMLGIALGTCLASAGLTVHADDATNEPASASAALKVRIDPDSGQKSQPDDSPAQASLAAQSAARRAGVASAHEAALARMAAATGAALDSQAPVRNSDGSLSAKVGLRDMKFMVVSIDEDGNKSVAHQSSQDLALESTAGPDAAPTERHEQGEK